MYSDWLTLHNQTGLKCHTMWIYYHHIARWLETQDASVWRERAKKKNSLLIRCCIDMHAFMFIFLLKCRRPVSHLSWLSNRKRHYFCIDFIRVGFVSIRFDWLIVVTVVCVVLSSSSTSISISTSATSSWSSPPPTNKNNNNKRLSNHPIGTCARWPIDMGIGQTLITRWLVEAISVGQIDSLYTSATSIYSIHFFNLTCSLYTDIYWLSNYLMTRWMGHWG